VRERQEYKKCHLVEDEQGTTQIRPGRYSTRFRTEFNNLRRRVGELLHHELPESETAQAVSEFFGSSKAEEGMGTAVLGAG